ncbi:MAG: hypothetical protein ABRQ37_02915 [Candidatus Eremiobacterota bacterium]
MNNPEIFNTATWNFLAGDRAVEDILKDRRLKKITVRGGIGTVLPTVAAIKDMEKLGWKDSIAADICVPSNGLSSHSGFTGEKIEENNFYNYLLEKIYGVQLCNYQYFPDQLIIIMNMTEENKEARHIRLLILNLLEQCKEEKIIFTCPRHERLLPEFRKYVIKSYSTIYWDGLNAFFSNSVEEAVKEINPQRIVVTGASEKHLFYTAIGAVDYFIIQDSLFNSPASLHLWDIMDRGKKVSIISPIYNEKKGKTSLEKLLLKHLTETFNVNVLPDCRYSTVAGHKIMIDIE